MRSNRTTRRLRLAPSLLAMALAAASATARAADVDTIVVTAKANDSLGASFSASAGVVGGVELSGRPILRPAEILESVPGMIVTAHTSGGKANQYYLRGFNLDHGTDFATSVEGVPVNLGSHAHGQGYMDLNWLIPELVASVTYRKGPYYADAGDFSAAGNANIAYLSVLPSNVAQIEGGTDDYERLFIAGSAALGPGHLLYAGEYLHDDGPFRTPADYRRPNGVLKYTTGDAAHGGGLTLQAYDAHWTASDQLPVAAIAGLPGGRFGTLDPTSGGQTSRYSLAGEWHWGTGRATGQVEAYLVKYRLNLFSDFSYYIDQAHGDQFRQFDDRTILGAEAQTAITSHYLGMGDQDGFGVQLRNDFITLELDHTEARRMLQVYRSDHVTLNSAALWWSNEIDWAPWLKSQGGLRLEAFHFNDHSNVTANAGDTSMLRPAPKISVILTPARDLDVYAQAGVSYRTNDARGVFDRAPSYPGGPAPTGRSRPVARSIGAEIGARLRGPQGLTRTLAFWWLQSDSELFFAGDKGSDVDSDRPGQRYGVEWNTIYRPAPWLTLDADLDASRALFTDHDKAKGDRIPEAIKASVSASATVHDIAGASGLSASLRLRYFASRDLTADGAQRSAPSTIVNAQLNYDVSARIAFGLEALNLFDVKYNDAEYYDSYRLLGQPANPASADGSYQGHVIHAGEPREIRASLTIRY